MDKKQPINRVTNMNKQDKKAQVEGFGGGVGWHQVLVLLLACYFLALILLYQYDTIILITTTLLIGVGGGVWGWIRIQGRRRKRDAHTGKPVPVLGKDSPVHKDAGAVRSGDRRIPAPRHRTFGEVVRQGWVAPMGDFVLGLGETTGEPFTMPALTSLGVSGGQGTGKSVTLLVLMLEAIIKYAGEVRFLVVDPHMYAGEESLVSKVNPLQPFFLSPDEIQETVPMDDYEYLSLLGELDAPNPTEGDTELKAWARVVMLEMNRRLHGKEGETWAIIIDEANTQLIYPEVSRMVEEVNRQARKVRMFTILSGQEWKATRVGGSELRHSVVSWVVHNTPESIAALVVPGDVAKKAMRMEPGQAIFYSRGRSAVGWVPFASIEDAERVALKYAPNLDTGYLDSPTPTTPLVLPPLENLKTNPLWGRPKW